MVKEIQEIKQKYCEANTDLFKLFTKSGYIELTNNRELLMWYFKIRQKYSDANAALFELFEKSGIIELTEKEEMLMWYLKHDIDLALSIFGATIKRLGLEERMG